MHGPDLSATRRWPSLALISLSLFLVLLPLTLSKPGLPVWLKADEAAFYLAALSLWHDHDLRCEDLDARRLFQEFAGTDNLLVMSKGRRQPVYFSIPISYPLVATPFVALFGANGMVMLNAALLIAMLWMGAAYLRRHNDESLATLFAGGFFLLSTASVYVFWLQAEVFQMTCVMAAFFLVERAAGGAHSSEPGSRSAPRLVSAAAGSAALLATACYSKPMLAALTLPLLYLLVRPEADRHRPQGADDRPVSSARAWRAPVAFAASGLVTALALTGTSYALTEQPWPYFAPRMGVSMTSPVDYVERRIDPRLPEVGPASVMSQIALGGKQLRVTMADMLLDAAPEFLFGRHGGFFIYMPFAVLCVLFFLLDQRRSAFRWLILASAALTAVLFVTVVRGQWLGGGGFVGNRYFTAVYPSFLFLARRLHPSWLIAPGFAAAAIFLGPLLITPLGAMVAEPTLQAHVRNQPFPRLPLEWTQLSKLAGYRQISQAGLGFHGRRDEIEAHRDEIWVHGAKTVEINILSPQEHQGFAFDVLDLAPDNSVEICLQSDCKQLAFSDVPATGSIRRVAFEALAGDRIPRSARGTETYKYRLTVATRWGEQPRWRGSGKERFYLGAALVYLGSPDDLARDLYAVDWLSAGAPSEMAAGGTVAVPIAIRNASLHAWPSAGATRVDVAYHWLAEDGAVVDWEGRRTALPGDVGAGAAAELELEVDAPETPGRYVLAFDLVRERVSWFSATDERQAHRVAVAVVAPSAQAGAR